MFLQCGGETCNVAERRKARDPIGVLRDGCKSLPALQEHQVAFGRGGFCIEKAESEEAI